MFFIFGVGPKTKVIEKSQFSCPVCRSRTQYELKQQRNYFSLFFIPLIPLSKAKASLVKCLHCGTEMPASVLHHASPDPQRDTNLEA